eukprot:TRINITY_DN6490_c0_g1_i1.p1 TRINITY_DN6490_c0_g1~~TRINITY_DN6490_c0_g1_i1.p1  ORF type:complete len:1337 (+),score=308.02 TRINITY_DN6490_c0_g1_i1:68-4078(+)
MKPGGHKELLWKAFEKYGFESSSDNVVLDLDGLKRILKELGLDGQDEVVDGIWKAMGGTSFVDWTAYSQVMLTITNAGPTPTSSMGSSTFDDIEVVSRQHPQTVHYSPPRHARVIPEFSSPLDLPDDRDNIPALETSTSRIAVANQLHEPVGILRDNQNREAALQERERRLAEREANLHHLQQSAADTRSIDNIRQRENDLLEREQELSRIQRTLPDPHQICEREDELNRRELALRRFEASLQHQQLHPMRSGSQHSIEHREREDALARKEAELRGWEDSLRRTRIDSSNYDLRRQIDDDAREREGHSLLRELTLRKPHHNKEKKDIDMDSTVSSIKPDLDQMQARESAMNAREHAGADTRARQAFRYNETDQRINIQELECTSRADIILRYWRKVSIKLSDVSEREYSLQVGEAKLASAMRDLEALRENFRREQLARSDKYQLDSRERERELAQKIADLASAEAKLAAERELLAQQQKQLQDKETLISIKEESFKHNEGNHIDIESQQSQLSDREQRLRQQEKEIMEKLAMLASRDEDLSNRERDIKNQLRASEGLASRSDGLSSRERDLADRAEELAKRERDFKNQLRQSEEDVARREEKVRKSEEDIARREEKIRDRESTLRDREDASRQREDQMRRHEDNLTDREAQIEVQNRRLKQLEYELKQLEEDLEKKRQRAVGDGESHRATIEQLRDQLREKDAKFAILQARLEEREKMSREWDKREQQRNVGEDKTTALHQQLSDSAQRLNEAIARATNAEVRCRELQRRLDAGEASGEREKILQQHESLLQSELQRVGLIERNLQEREKALEKRKVAIERWIATLTKREAALQGAEDRLNRDGEGQRAAAQTQEYLERERASLAEKERQLELMAMKVKGQEMEWIAWAEVVKQREADTLRELTQLKADLATEELSKKAAQQKLETNAAIQETSRILSEARSDTDLVLDAARRLYEKTVGMQEQLDRRQRDLDIRESVLHVREASIPPPGAIAVPIVTQQEVSPVLKQPVVLPAVHSPLAHPVPSPPGSIFDIVPLSTHRDLEGYDVLHGLNHSIAGYHPPIEGAVDKPSTPFLPPVPVELSDRCPSPMCDYEIEIPCGSEGPPAPSVPSVDDATTVVDNAPVALQLEAPSSWFNTSLDIAYGTPTRGNEPRSRPAEPKRAIVGAPLGEVAKATSKISNEMDRLGEKLMMKNDIKNDTRNRSTTDNMSTTREVSTGSISSLGSMCSQGNKHHCDDDIQTVEVRLSQKSPVMTHTPRLQHSASRLRTSKLRRNSPSIGGPAGRSSSRCSTPTGRRNSTQPSPSPRIANSQRSHSVDVVSIVTQSVSRMMNNSSSGNL